MTEFTPDEIAAFESFRAQQLFCIARQMSDLGLAGEDPDDPRIRLLLETGAAATETYADLVAWIAKRRPKSI